MYRKSTHCYLSNINKTTRIFNLWLFSLNDDNKYPVFISILTPDSRIMSINALYKALGAPGKLTHDSALFLTHWFR